MSKRARSASSVYRVVLNVGGTPFETSVDMCKRHSTYLDGLLDCAAWETNAEHKPEVFLDRDPELFAPLLRYMRNNVPSLVLPSGDMLTCGAILAE